MTLLCAPTRPRSQIHPSGFEPLTFGSVDRRRTYVRITPARLWTQRDPGLPTDNRQIDADLTVVVDAWAELPEAIRAGILAMVRAARREREGPE